MKITDKVKNIVFLIICTLQISSTIGVFIYWLLNDELSQMQVFKEVWWWYIPTALISLYLIIKLDKHEK